MTAPQVYEAATRKLADVVSLCRVMIAEIEKMGCTCADDMFAPESSKRNAATGHESGCRGYAAAEDYEQNLLRLLRG